MTKTTSTWIKAIAHMITRFTALGIFLVALVVAPLLAQAKDDSNPAIKTDGNNPVMVRIPGKNYEIGKYEVTQAEWRAVMGNNPSEFKNCGDNCPVENVSWNDAQEFIQKLNAKTGKQYRLPTEAEWENACYGGNKTEYCGGNDLAVLGWFEDNSQGKTQLVGQKQANGYGLNDMSGNVWEWFNDCWKGDCSKHVLGGGSWINNARIARTLERDGFESSIRNWAIGFRLARTLP